MFRLSTRKTLALTLATVTGLLVPAAQADGDKGDRSWRDNGRHNDGRSGRDRKGYDRRDDDHRHHGSGISIRIGTPPIIIREPVVVRGPVVSRPRPQHVVVAQPCDVMPQDLRITAYQTHDRVIVLITGTNHSAGYATSLTDVDTSCEVPTLTLRNTAPMHASAQCLTGFSLNAAVRSRETLCTIRVLVAGRTVEVPVTQVPTLS